METDDGTDVVKSTLMDSISVILYPAIRLVVAGATVWYASGASA